MKATRSYSCFKSVRVLSLPTTSHTLTVQIIVFVCNIHCTAQIAAFFGVFYTIVGGIFAVHLAVFITISPQPAEDIAPWNFGRYAYSNYPNAKIGRYSVSILELISVTTPRL